LLALAEYWISDAFSIVLKNFMCQADILVLSHNIFTFLVGAIFLALTIFAGKIQYNISQ